MEFALSDEEAEQFVPLLKRPEAPRTCIVRAGGPAAEAAAADLNAARVEAQQCAPTPAVQLPRDQTLPPPPVGWRFGQGLEKIRLMADGATTADRGLVQVLKERTSPDTELDFDEFGCPPESGGAFWKVSTDSIKLWDGQPCDAYMAALKEYAVLNEVALDIEYKSQVSSHRPRPNGLGGGKVATIQIFHPEAILGYFVHIIWLPGYETDNVLQHDLVADIEAKAAEALAGAKRHAADTAGGVPVKKRKGKK